MLLTFFTTHVFQFRFAELSIIGTPNHPSFVMSSSARHSVLWELGTSFFLRSRIRCWLSLNRPQRHLEFSCQWINIVPVTVFAFVNNRAEQFRGCSCQYARTYTLDSAGSEGFERHESRCNKPQLDPVVLHRLQADFHVWVTLLAIRRAGRLVATTGHFFEDMMATCNRLDNCWGNR